MYSAYKLNKQGDNIQPWPTPFPTLNQSVVPYPDLTGCSIISFSFFFDLPFGFLVFSDVFISFFLLFLALVGLHCWTWAFLCLASGGHSLLWCVGSHFGGLSCCRAQTIGVLASVVAVYGLSSFGLQALEHSLSSCWAQAQLLHGMWDPPAPGIEPVSPALQDRFLTTRPPGKPSCIFFLFLFLVSLLVVNLLSHVWLLVSSPAVAHQCPLSMGFPRQEYWSGLPFTSPGYLSSQPRDQTLISFLADKFFTTEPPEKCLL